MSVLPLGESQELFLYLIISVEHGRLAEEYLRVEEPIFSATSANGIFGFFFLQK